MYRTIIILHLLGAAVWVGGHLVLTLSILPRALRARDPSTVLNFEGAYERVGMPALLIQVLTGLWLAHHWVPDVAAWFTPSTAQAWLILTKLGLLAATVLLAAHARLRVIPRLDARTLPLLALHIVAVTIIAVAFLVVGVGVRMGGLT
jgi:putative copper export protein